MVEFSSLTSCKRSCFKLLKYFSTKPQYLPWRSTINSVCKVDTYVSLQIISKHVVLKTKYNTCIYLFTESFDFHCLTVICNTTNPELNLECLTYSNQIALLPQMKLVLVLIVLVAQWVPQGMIELTQHQPCRWDYYPCPLGGGGRTQLCSQYSMIRIK